MKKLIVVLLLLVGCTVVQNATDSIQRNFRLQCNFRLQQLEHGLSFVTGKVLYQ